MIIKDLANKSWCTVNTYVDSTVSIEMTERYILYNLDFLKEFKNIVIGTTYKEYPALSSEHENLWKSYFPECKLIDIETNRGHAFGIADTENALVEFCKRENIQWICKLSGDVVVNSSFLYQEIGEADFYYTNGISYEDLYKFNFDYEKLFSQHFFPQTNLYFINVEKIDFLYDKEYVDSTYLYRLGIENYNNKIWEYIPGWACELFLKNCVQRNNLKKEYLLNYELHSKLCKVVEMYKIGDPSHKNIMILGVCHLQYPEQEILEL